MRILALNEVSLRTGIAVLVVLASVAGSPRLLAQASSEITHPAADPTHDLTTKEFAKDIWLNFRGLLSPGNAKLLAAGGVLTGLSVIPEQNIEAYFDRGAHWGTWTEPGRYIGSSVLVGGASALLFAVSRGSQDRRFRSFSYAAVQGMIVNESLVQAIKPAVHRERPNHEDKRAFPSGHAATSFMDAQLGVVLDAMDRNKLWDSTVVLLFGDHGWHLYDHLGLWRKMTVFEEAAHAPLIVRTPGGRSGVASPRMVEFVDIYPTLTELCGLPQAPGMEGLSFAPLMKNPSMPWKKAAYTMVLRGRDSSGKSVRTERYRYTEWNGGKDGVEFYDHEKDPHEWTNLAWGKRKPDAKTIAQMEEMRKLLHADQRANAR